MRAAALHTGVTSLSNICGQACCSLLAVLLRCTVEHVGGLRAAFMACHAIGVGAYEVLMPHAELCSIMGKGPPQACSYTLVQLCKALRRRTTGGTKGGSIGGWWGAEQQARGAAATVAVGGMAAIMRGMRAVLPSRALLAIWQPVHRPLPAVACSLPPPHSWALRGRRCTAAGALRWLAGMPRLEAAAGANTHSLFLQNVAHVIS